MKKYFAFVTLLIVIVFTFTSTEKKHTNSSTHPLVTVKCKNTAIPHFTLDYDANPSEEEIDELCSCIWDKLVGWEKETVIQLTSGKEDEISAVHMAGFPVIFGKRISECGGEQL
ncbi:hypothetical protein [Sulfurovum sp.]|uniref:hypothetical protein n=1 Tax=Sulfurovum sp. TaxID=1969726 RepID=UPI0028681B78|nr:hypothetical protein [Sulfurovum sp.]